MEKNKLAIVTSGGGMSCSYSAGVILALANEFNLTTPDIAIAVSGSAGTLAYYVAGQYDSIRNIWENLLGTKKIINFLRPHRIADVDYLIDYVLKKQDPLCVDKIFSSQTKLIIPCTNYQTGEVKFFNNQCGADIFEILRATKAIPVGYRKTVDINGENFCDGHASSDVNFLIRQAIAEGATKIIAIDNMFPESMSRICFNIWLKTRNNQFKANHQKILSQNKNLVIPEDVKILFIKPTKELKAKTASIDHAILKEAMRQGYSDTVQNNKLEKFLS